MTDPTIRERLRDIRKRDDQWQDGFRLYDDDFLRQHPDTECPADRDRHTLLTELDTLERRAIAIAEYHSRRNQPDCDCPSHGEARSLIESPTEGET